MGEMVLYDMMEQQCLETFSLLRLRIARKFADIIVITWSFITAMAAVAAIVTTRTTFAAHLAIFQLR